MNDSPDDPIFRVKSAKSGGDLSYATQNPRLAEHASDWRGAKSNW